MDFYIYTLIAVYIEIEIAQKEVLSHARANVFLRVNIMAE